MEDTTRLCPECGMAMPPVKHGGRGGLKRFCSERCRVRVYRREHPEYVAKSRERGRIRAQKKAAERDLADPRPRCRNCGEEMRRRKDAVYCDAQLCRTAKYHAKQASRPRCSTEGCDYPVIARGLCGSHYSVEWRSENLDRSRANAKRRRAVKRGARVEDFASAEVFERDGWICGLCSAPIPRDAVWPDLLSPSVDHIVPLSRGGEHSMANVQASHLSCNSRKQASVPVEAVASGS